MKGSMATLIQGILKYTAELDCVLEKCLDRDLASVDPIERAVNNAFRDGLFTIIHDHVHELGQQFTAIFWIRQDSAFRSLCSSGH